MPEAGARAFLFRKSGSSCFGGKARRPSPPEMNRPRAEALIAVLFLGGVPVTIKGVSADPWVIGIVRLSAAVFLTCLLLPGVRQVFRCRRRDWGVLALIGFSFGLHWVTYFWGIKLASASVACIGMATFGVQVSILGMLFLGQKPTVRQIIALIISLGGTLLVLDEYTLGSDMTTGFLLALLSGSLYALLPIWHQKFAEVPVNIRTLGQYLFALPLFLVFLPRARWELTPGDWLGLAYLSIFGTFIAHTLWIRATTVLPAVTSGLIYYLYVPLAVFFSWLFLNEDIGWSRIIGATLIVGASIFGARSGRPRPGRDPVAVSD